MTNTREPGPALFPGFCLEDRASEQLKLVGSSRDGTCIASRASIVDQFGTPNFLGICDKVKEGWAVSTPHGMAVLRDYYWNGKQAWTLAAQNKDAYEDFCALLVYLGFRVLGWEDCAG